MKSPEQLQVWLCHFSAEWPQANNFTSPSLSFLICEVGVMINDASSWGWSEYSHELLCIKRLEQCLAPASAMQVWALIIGRRERFLVKLFSGCLVGHIQRGYDAF